MTTKDTVSLDGVSVESLRLLGEDVLVRPFPAEEVRASGLFLPNAAPENFLGMVFYGEVVKVGPGRLVERGPSPGEVAWFISETLGARWYHDYHDAPSMVAGAVGDFIREHTHETYVPMPWKPGDRVACRQGFGPEILLREGRHHIVGRGNKRLADNAHGIIAAWSPEHVHCWHVADSDAPMCYAHGVGLHELDPKVKGCTDTQGRPISMPNCGRLVAECACGESKVIETRLPACVSCPPGERLAEAVLGGEVYSAKFGRNDQPGAFEMRPEDDGREDL